MRFNLENDNVPFKALDDDLFNIHYWQCSRECTKSIQPVFGSDTVIRDEVAKIAGSWKMRLSKMEDASERTAIT